MATKREIAKSLAQRIEEALRKDRLTRYSTVTASGLRGTEIVRELKELAKVLREARLPDGKPLTEGEQDETASEAGEILGVPDPRSVGRAIKKASNDNLMDLVDEIDKIIKK